MDEKELKDHRAKVIEELRRTHPKGFCYICGKGSVTIHHLRNIRTKGKGTITGEIPLCRCCHDAVEQTKKFKKLKDAYNTGKEKRNSEVKQAIEKAINVINKLEITYKNNKTFVHKEGVMKKLKGLLQGLGLGDESEKL